MYALNLRYGIIAPGRSEEGMGVGWDRERKGEIMKEGLKWEGGREQLRAMEEGEVEIERDRDGSIREKKWCKRIIGRKRKRETENKM